MLIKSTKFNYEDHRGVREREVNAYLALDAEPADGEVWFISLYTVTRHYGGREEGGWWYDWTAHEWTVPFIYSEQAAIMMIDSLVERASEAIHGDINSVLGGQDAYLRVEKVAGEAADKERPYYD